MIDLPRISERIKDMDNVELFQYLHETPGNYSNYSSLYIYLAKHGPMDDYYRRLFKDIPLKGKTFLDLGPGVGASLDVARDLGATTYFVDKDVFISKYCENKGHELISLDFFQLPIRPIGIYDVVLSRGSLNVDWMNDVDFNVRGFLYWLICSGRHIIVLPTWNKGPLIEGQDYTCVGEHLEQYLTSKVHQAFMDFGFKQKTIEGINDRLRFPITYEYFK